jgi:hypothetical protein
MLGGPRKFSRQARTLNPDDMDDDVDAGPMDTQQVERFVTQWEKLRSEPDAVFGVGPDCSTLGPQPYHLDTQASDWQRAMRWRLPLTKPQELKFVLFSRYMGSPYGGRPSAQSKVTGPTPIPFQNANVRSPRHGMPPAKRTAPTPINSQQPTAYAYISHQSS